MGCIRPSKSSVACVLAGSNPTRLPCDCILLHCRVRVTAISRRAASHISSKLDTENAGLIRILIVLVIQAAADSYTRRKIVYGRNPVGLVSAARVFATSGSRSRSV